MSTSSKNNTYRMCVSVYEPTPRKMASSLRRAMRDSDYAELRLDALVPAEVPTALELARPYLKRCVCTLRPKSEGGAFSGSNSERISILKLVSEYSPMLLDVEFNTIRSSESLRRYVRRSDILVSWHNFKTTPSIAVLRRKLADMSRYSSHVKIVTTATRYDHASRVLALYSAPAKTRLVAFCMGDEGRASRVLCLYLGSPFTYVSQGPPVAPGQMSLREMRALLP